MGLSFLFFLILNKTPVYTFEHKIINKKCPVPRAFRLRETILLNNDQPFHMPLTAIIHRYKINAIRKVFNIHTVIAIR